MIRMIRLYTALHAMILASILVTLIASQLVLRMETSSVGIVLLFAVLTAASFEAPLYLSFGKAAEDIKPIAVRRRIVMSVPFGVFLGVSCLIAAWGFEITEPFAAISVTSRENNLGSPLLNYGKGWQLIRFQLTFCGVLTSAFHALVAMKAIQESKTG